MAEFGGGESPMPHPQVGPVQSVQDDRCSFAGSGFVVYANDGTPAVTLGFANIADAQAAAKQMNEIIALCKEVMKAPWTRFWPDFECSLSLTPADGPERKKPDAVAPGQTIKSICGIPARWPFATRRAQVGSGPGPGMFLAKAVP